MAHKAAVEADASRSSRWNNLGTTLQTLGEFSLDTDTLREAVNTLKTALALEDRQTTALRWATAQSNLALAERWLGDVTDDLNMLTTARQSYAASESGNYRDTAPFKWATLQWNIADLAVARHRLEPDPSLLAEARSHVDAARSFFVEGSDYQTQRCDDLLAKIAQAET